MNGLKRLSAAIGYIALAAAAFVIMFMVMDIEPTQKKPPPQATSPKPIEPATQSTTLEVLREPEPVPKAKRTKRHRTNRGSSATPFDVPVPKTKRTKRHRTNRGSSATPLDVPVPIPETDKDPHPTPPPTLPPLQAIYVVKDDQPPPLKVTTPRGRSYVIARLLPVRTRSEAGAQVELNGNPLTEINAGVFSGTVKLKPGENQLNFSARDAVGNTSAVTLRVTYVEPKRIRRVQTRFTTLLGQLEEVRSNAGEIDRQTEAIIGRIENIHNAETVNQLSRELREIRNTRRELQKEIGKAIREIDKFLSKYQ
jgi:hypothetical protein